ncbi:MAG: dihydroneopterin aldolase [Brooklawnia sp.]|uniref:dihydroneopterin aldolase n=1 Tax=Brooklawnia sp. TaxID=2699740 RepID=UPI003C714DA2
MDDRLVTITLSGLRAQGFHGVLEIERRTGQEFVVDLALEVAAPSADDIAETVHYGELAGAVVAIIEGEPVNLIETLADRIADAVLSDRRIRRLTVTVHKPHAPIPEKYDDVSVTISRSNDD